MIDVCYIYMYEFMRDFEKRMKRDKNVHGEKVERKVR